VVVRAAPVVRARVRRHAAQRYGDDRPAGQQDRRAAAQPACGPACASQVGITDRHDRSQREGSRPVHAGFRITSAVDDITIVELDIVPCQVATFDGDALVKLSPEFERLWTELGWTPPGCG
jgi:hypothetical protein